MKATEIQIGDWYDWEAEGKKYYYQVTKETFAEDDDTIANFESVPLTAEILEKNGFIYIENPHHDYYKHYFLTDEKVFAIRRNTLILHDEKWFVGINYLGAKLSLFFNYVHELQRALRCCGLWDLAENFKI